ncbi:zf-TFIIB domain-containing protein [Lysobacter niabensis]|uniref:TFIIB-type zinc ribbon-containing protein n=1 Tax=Agrilutibacter niabensis TaxID=380628 RepID=UPI00360CBF4D
MQCPKCQSAMTPHTYEGSVVQRCNGCSGLWFEAVDHERLKDLAEDIDIGDPALGAQYNHIDRINCPNCPSWQMLRMVDPQQPHIWFESCKHCYGRFYDAGEYRDFANYTLAKFFQDLTAPERN